MIERELTDQELLYASEEDWAFYNERILPGLPTMAGVNGDGLDKFGVPIPYHSGPHILRHFRDAIKIVQPQRIFEIGFNMGHSAAMWLALSDAEVVSCDVSKKEETIEGANVLDERCKYDGRFTFNWRDEIPVGEFTNPYTQNYFDLAFIDGAHDEKSIIEDTELCINLKIPYILYDDWYERFGATKLAVTHFHELELVKDMNNLRLYKLNYGS